MEHSKLPWSIKSYYGDTGIEDADGAVIAQNTQFYPIAPSEEDMQFIVRACNAHEQLVTALKQLREDAVNNDHGYVVDSIDKALTAAGAA